MDKENKNMLIEALNTIEKEKDIPKEVLLEAIETALVAAVKNEGTDNLDLEWFLLDGSPRAFSRNSEGLVFDVLKGFAVLQSLFEFGGFGTELVISSFAELLVISHNAVRFFCVAVEFAFF